MHMDDPRNRIGTEDTGRFPKLEPWRVRRLILRRLDGNADRPRSRETWTESIAIVARGPDAPPRVAEMLKLDDRGIATLREVLSTARAASNPFKLVVLDSLSRLKPERLIEDKTDDMTPWLDALHHLAHEQETLIVLVHHSRKGADGAVNGGGDPFDAIRGSGSILAVADVALLLRRDGDRFRELLARGNCIPDA